MLTDEELKQLATLILKVFPSPWNLDKPPAEMIEAAAESLSQSIPGPLPMGLAPHEYHDIASSLLWAAWEAKIGSPMEDFMTDPNPDAPGLTVDIKRAMEG